MADKPFNIIDVAKGELTGTAQYASAEQRAARMKICEACPDRNAALSTCKICHCWLPGKTKYSRSTCPKGLW